jgi:mRNA-degrading endonuclease RelE of RelBE toxin-antitoxin system
MSYNVNSIPLFDKQAKRLAKKYPSLKKDLAELIKKLADDPEQGISLGNGFYKVRLAIASKSKGKSGGARVITYVKILLTTVIFHQFMIKEKKIPSQIKNCNRFLKKSHNKFEKVYD